MKRFLTQYAGTQLAGSHAVSLPAVAVSLSARLLSASVSSAHHLPVASVSMSHTRRLMSSAASASDVGTAYDAARKDNYTRAIIKEAGYRAMISDTVFPSLLAHKLFRDNVRDNSIIIDDCRQKEQSSQHPNPQDAGKTFIRSTVGEKKTLVPPTPHQIRTAPFIVVGGKDSSQTPKDCSAIAGLAERHLGVETPEQLWSLVGGAPLVYLSQSTTPVLDRYASEGHRNYKQGIAYTHQEAEHFARTVLAPRFFDKDRKIITDPEQITPLCGYSYSAGGKQWLANIQALEDILRHEGMAKKDAQELISQTVRLAGIALMPDIRGLSMRQVSSLYSVSIFDGGTRPQQEEYKRIFGNPEMEKMLKENGGVAFVHVEPHAGMKIRHRIAVFGEMGSGANVFGHSPKVYEEQIRTHPVLLGLYKAYLKGSRAEIADFEGKFDERSISFNKLALPREQEVIDETGLTPWEQKIIGNFTVQLAKERSAKQKVAFPAVK